MSEISTRVLVLWADSRSPNFGVRVLAEGMAELARAAWGPNVEVDLQDYGVGDSEVSFGTKTIARDVGRKRGPIKQKLRQYDLILDSGAGDSFADIYGLKRLSFMVYAQQMAKKLGIPVLMGPQTIGPFNTVIGRFAARRTLRRVDAVITRDTKSAEYSALLGRAADLVSTDVVFALAQPTVSRDRDVVINVSGLLWFGDEHVDSERYRREVAALVTALRERGRAVTLLAHVVKSARGNDDADAIDALQTQLGTNLEAIVPSTLEEVRSTVAGAKLVVGARMHACLNALSVGTPAIAWAYSRKFAPLMADIGWDAVVDLTDSAISPSTHTLLIIDAIDHGLAEKVLAVRERARVQLDKTVAMLRLHSGR